MSNPTHRGRGEPAPTGEQAGREYIVRYSTSPYQNGTLVLRFPADPGRRELVAAVAGYGIDPGQLVDISAAPFPTLADRRMQRPSATASAGRAAPPGRGPSRPYSPTAPVSHRPDPGGSPVPHRGIGPRPGEQRVSRASQVNRPGGQRAASAPGTSQQESGITTRPAGRGGFLRTALVLLVLGFAALTFFNFEVREFGTSVGRGYVDVGQSRWEYCQQAIEVTALSEAPVSEQFISAYPTEFPITPPNASFLLGCMFADNG